MAYCINFFGHLLWFNKTKDRVLRDLSVGRYIYFFSPLYKIGCVGSPDSVDLYRLFLAPV